MKQRSEVTPDREPVAAGGQPTLHLPRKTGNHSPPGRRARAGAPRSELSPEDRQRLIAVAAYYRAERRGFAPGGELEDWCAAEAEIDQRLQRA